MSKEVKNPFELRMEMIQTAKEMLEKQFELNKEIAMKTWSMAAEAAKAAQLSAPDIPRLAYPSYDEIVALAQKMNSFVSGK